MSRRIQGRGNIRRPQNQQYINTKYLPHDKTIQSVHYYNRRKHQMKSNPQSIPNQQHSESMQFKNQLSTLVNGKKNDSKFAHNLKEVEVEPVQNAKTLMNFSEEMYPLQLDEIVEVEESERMFKVQSYYTYIYQQQMKKQINKFAHQTQQKVIEAVQEKQFSEQEEVNYRVQSHNNSPNMSKYGSKARTKAVNELVPVHIDYAGNNYQPNLVFTLKQNQRLQMSRRR